MEVWIVVVLGRVLDFAGAEIESTKVTMAVQWMYFRSVVILKNPRALQIVRALQIRGYRPFNYFQLDRFHLVSLPFKEELIVLKRIGIKVCRSFSDMRLSLSLTPQPFSGAFPGKRFAQQITNIADNHLRSTTPTLLL